MDERSVLDQLAEAAGIESGYYDEWGNLRLAPSATKKALLEAMGLQAGTEVDARRSLVRLQEAPWRQVLPPVVVWDGTQGPPAVPVVTTPAHAGRMLRWSLHTELGETIQAEGQPEGLSLIDECTIDDERLERRLLPLPAEPPLGYHHLRFYHGEEVHVMPFIAVPRECHLPEVMVHDERSWGFSFQLYGLRSRDNWGIGDFGDLTRLVDLAGSLGADAVGLNPLHALFPGNPAHASPYSPSSRLFVNVLYINVTSVPDFEESRTAWEMAGSDHFVQHLEKLRGKELVDYPAVAEAKFQVLEVLYQSFAERHLGGETAGAETERGAEFRRFQAAGGDGLERHAIFEAITEHFEGRPWREWPAGYRDPVSKVVKQFARQYRNRVEYFQYLQWLSDQQLHRAADKTSECGMRIGLYHDLALAVDGGGADAWGQQDLYAEGAAIGAPPDAWNHLGQNWGTPPMNPLTLREQGFAPFAAVLAANMRHGGALRLDHAMSLQRLYWIPANGETAEGAYVRQPFEELMGILALESQRQQCMVIGEDLGTVSPGFRDRMREAKVLSYRLLYFERDEKGALALPEAYPKLSAVVVGTHDLAPLPGFWIERDLDLRGELGLYPSRTMELEARAERDAFRQSLIAMLKYEQLLPADTVLPTELTEELVFAVYHHLARTPGRLLIVQPEDVLGVTEQSNLPGTILEHPNWRRKLPLSLEEMARDPRILDLAMLLCEIRGPSKRAPTTATPGGADSGVQ